MKLTLLILQIAVLITMLIALLQSWRIIKKGRDEETLSEEESKAFSVRLTVIQVCLGIEAVIVIFRIFLPLFFK